jgi:cell pole-organizing protein PopZ
MAQQGEPSVEDILASIKKVIARDSREESRPRRVAEPEADMDEGEAVLDLVEEVPVDDSVPLVTEQSRVSMRESLAALSVMAQPGVAPQIVRSGETSLEGMTRELLRPALAEWLDKNLPPLVEQMVAAEIARIVGKKV